MRLLAVASSKNRTNEARLREFNFSIARVLEVEVDQKDVRVGGSWGCDFASWFCASFRVNWEAQASVALALAPGLVLLLTGWSGSGTRALLCFGPDSESGLRNWESDAAGEEAGAVGDEKEAKAE